MLDDAHLDDVVEVTADDLGRPALPARALLRVDTAELASLLDEDELALLLTARDESDANVSARQERLAAIERGEDRPPRDRVPRPGATLSFGDAPEPDEDAFADSPFAALRGLGGAGRPGDG